MSPYIRITDLSSTSKKPGLLPISAATVWRWVADGKFPPPFKIGSNTTVWDRKEVLDYIEQKHRDATLLRE